MKNNRVLLIDDDVSLVGILAIKLGHSGYEVDTAFQGTQGFTMATNSPYDVVVLDVTMPGIDGFDVCRNLRAHGILTPILMLSGLTEKQSIVKSLDFGADDYLTKPFSHQELIARLKALVRRNHKSFTTRTIQKSGLELDTSTGHVIFGEQSILLTSKETLLLKRLMYDTPEPVPRLALLKDVWEIDHTHTSNRLDVYVRRLRAKLESVGAEDLIHTLRGRGYYFGDIKNNSVTRLKNVE